MNTDPWEKRPEDSGSALIHEGMRCEVKALENGVWGWFVYWTGPVLNCPLNNARGVMPSEREAKEACLAILATAIYLRDKNLIEKPI